MSRDYIVYITIVDGPAPLPTPGYLVDVLMWGISQHNDAVATTGENDIQNRYDEDAPDHAINPVAMKASPAFNPDDVAMVLNDEETYTNIAGCTLRPLPDDFPYSPVDQPVLFRF